MDHGGVDINGTTVVLYRWDHGDPFKKGFQMARSDAQLKLRLPCSHKAWVEEKAKEEFHSMQAVVLRLIDEAKKKDEEIKRA